MKYSDLTVPATLVLSVTSVPVRNGQAKAVDCVLTRSPAGRIYALAEKRRTNQEIIDEARRLQEAN